jgi:hypothetical protein
MYIRERRTWRSSHGSVILRSQDDVEQRMRKGCVTRDEDAENCFDSYRACLDIDYPTHAHVVVHRVLLDLTRPSSIVHGATINNRMVASRICCFHHALLTHAIPSARALSVVPATSRFFRSYLVIRFVMRPGCPFGVCESLDSFA